MANFRGRLSRGLAADARARQYLTINMVYYMVMIRVNLAEAKAKLSAYVNQASEGQTVIICRRNVPVAELRPVTQPATDQRPVGIDRGMEIPDSFFEPLPSDLVDALEGTLGDE